MKNCSSGAAGVHFTPKDRFYKALQEHGRVKLWISADQLSLSTCTFNYFTKALFGLSSLLECSLGAASPTPALLDGNSILTSHLQH